MKIRYVLLIWLAILTLAGLPEALLNLLGW